MIHIFIIKRIDADYYNRLQQQLKREELKLRRKPVFPKRRYGTLFHILSLRRMSG